MGAFFFLSFFSFFFFDFLSFLSFFFLSETAPGERFRAAELPGGFWTVFSFFLKLQCKALHAKQVSSSFLSSLSSSFSQSLELSTDSQNHGVPVQKSGAIC